MTFVFKIKKAVKQVLLYLLQNFIFYKQLFQSSDIVVMYIPGDNMISGGILSIYSFYYISKEILTDKSVFICTSSGSKAIRRYTWFKNQVDLIKLNIVLNNINRFNSLLIHIPECFTINFLNDLNRKQKDGLMNLSNLHINIMNQNNELMPSKLIFLQLKELTSNVTITAAHKQYASAELSMAYDVPVHYLSAWFEQNEIHPNSYVEKEDILIISPDEHPRKSKILKILKEQLPHIKQIVIKNMRYDDYKLLEQKAKWSISFGEGFDGYTIFPVLKGGISFAVYNDTFFDSIYAAYPNFYMSYDLMEDSLVKDIIKLDNESHYNSFNEKLRLQLERDYSYVKYIDRVRSFYNKNYAYA